MTDTYTPNDLRNDLDRYLAECTKDLTDFTPLDPGNYVPWHWPLHPVSSDYHLPHSLWKECGNFEFEDRQYRLECAESEYGVFGRIPDLIAEALGNSKALMEQELAKVIAPYFERQKDLAKVLHPDGNTERFEGSIKSLAPADLIKLLFSPNRSLGHAAANLIESVGPSKLYGSALARCLEERRHPYRRAAQWQALNLFEEAAFFFEGDEWKKSAVDAISRLMKEDSQDDIARTIYKAGVVLGGHLCTEEAADALLEIAFVPSRVARRSALHAMFHLAEWLPHRKADVLEAFQRAVENDPEPKLREFARCQYRDTHENQIEHVTEPLFENEV